MKLKVLDKSESGACDFFQFEKLMYCLCEKKYFEYCFRYFQEILLVLCCRRFIWNFFRLENEHLNNCGQFRAVRDISIAPINADDQSILEEMMDKEDGVLNRRRGKKHKSAANR